MGIRSGLVDGTKKAVPDYLKSFRQELRLKRAGKIFGLSTEFPIGAAESHSPPTYLVGGGASVLDFDFSSKEFATGTKIAMGPAIFLEEQFDFGTFEAANEVEYMNLVGRRVREMSNSSETQFILRIPHVLRMMRAQPTIFTDLADRSHLMASIDLLEPKTMEAQLGRYLSPKVDISKPGLDPRFTLGRMIIRLIKLGHKDIRLVGIDLITSDYFYHSSDKYIELKRALPAASAGTHSTANREKIWPAPLFLDKIIRYVEQDSFRISVDRNSPASSFLPVFN